MTIFVVQNYFKELYNSNVECFLEGLANQQTFFQDVQFIHESRNGINDSICIIIMNLDMELKT